MRTMGRARRCTFFGLLPLIVVFNAPSARAAVGVTPGAPSVSPSGTAGYEIPLTLPPGTNGLTPSLSLRYSHTQGGGLFGVGWSMTGLSAIVRCNKTYAQDAGVPSAATLSVSDGYCLDGNRLRLQSGTYGAAGAVFRTETETFSRVLVSAANGNGPLSWEVRGKDGLIYEYGNTTDSRIEAVGPGIARLWALNKIRDRSNNYIEILYTEDPTNGSFRPDKIRYTGNSTQGTTPATEVQFFYQTVPVGEVDSEYFAGGLIKRVTRADYIDVVHNGTTLVHRYELTYEGSLSSTSKSRLASIQECADTTPDCFPATTFVYQNGTPGLGSETNTTHPVPTAPWSIDVNGDGRDDLVYSSSTGSGTWKVMFANSSGGYNTPVDTTHPNTNYAGATPIDYNADGLEDLLVPYTGGTWWVLLGTPSGLAAHANTNAPVTTTGTGSNARAIDINGDGYEDLVWADLIGYAGGDAIRYRSRLPAGGFSSTVTTLVGPLTADSKISFAFANAAQSRTHRIPDFNGDGRGDIVYQRTVRVFNKTDYLYFYNAWAVCSGAWTFSTATGAASEAYFGDFNGDQMDDLFYYTSDGLFKVRFSRGTSFASEIIGPSLANYGIGVAILDWEGDGYEDILAPQFPSGLWHRFRSTGEGLTNLGSTGIASAGVGNATVADMNGDGLSDLVYTLSGTWRYRPHAGTYPDFLQTATDGFGIAATFNYLPLTNSSGFYTKGSGSVFPVQEYRGATWVVNTRTASNGIGGTYTLTHTYESARLHLQGRGFLGYGLRKVTDSRNGLRSEVTHLQNPADYQAIGAPSLVLLKQSSGTAITETTNTWNKVIYGSGVTESRFPFISQQVVKRREAEGTYDGDLVSTATTTNTVDLTSYGTIYDSTTTTVEATTANGVQTSASYSARVYHPPPYMLNDTSSNWCIGRPGRTELINSHNQPIGGTQITRTVSRTWNATNCRITQEITEPDSTQWKVTRDLGYDNWGNINSDSITGIGMSARTTTASWGTTGRFLQSVTNPLSQAMQFGWNATIGTLTSTTDPNGIVTSWQYDVFGRRTQENRPDGTDTTVSYNDCSGVAGGCVNSNNKTVVIATQRDTVDGVITDQWTYLDKFNRPIVAKTRRLSGEDDTRVDREYDALGRVNRESAPCAWSGCTNYWTTFTYDLLDRPTAHSRPISDSNPTVQTTSSFYEGLTTRVVDPQSKQSTKIANVVGGLARSMDHDGYYQTFDVDAFGDTVRVTDSLSNTSQSITYNVRGMKTAATDMDLGAWTYLPNALGELEKIRDAKTTPPNWTTIIGYDPLGRMTTRQDVPEALTSTWTWGTLAHNDATHKYIGRLKQVSGGGYTEVYTNDSIGRPQTTSITSDATYSIDYAYNTIGQLDTLTYPISTSSYRLKLKYEYENALLKRVKDFNAPTTVFWQADSTDVRGNVILEQLDNGLETARGYDLVTGLIDSITTGPGGGTSIQNLSYAWDKVGNLTQRQDVRQSLTENFTYDNLHRLTSSTGPDPITVAYNAMGNITSKTGVGSYSYHATKKHAVTAAGTYSFAYDANGNVSTRNGSTISWYSYNLPNTLSASGSNSSQFFYTPERSRWKQVASYGGTTETTIYIGGLIEKVTLGAVTSWKHTIAGGSGPVAIYTRKSGAADEMHYLTRDHLGSVDSVTNGAGAIEVRLSFGSFGARRKEAGWSGNPTSGDWSEITDTTRRGFTFHEMLDNLNLTHMNGRVYDQVVGRFISADPYVPEPGLTQSFNRYSYVRNNPLSFTDPSGFFEEYGKQVCKDACYSFSSGFTWINVVFSVWGRPVYNPVIAVPPGAASTPVDPPPAPDPPPDPEPPAPDPIDEKVNVTVTSCPNDFMPCGSTVGRTGNDTSPWQLAAGFTRVASTTTVGEASGVGLGRFGEALRTLGARLSLWLSIATISGSTRQDQYIHYGYAAQAAQFAYGLRPDSWATRGPIMNGETAQQVLALPNENPPDSYYVVTLPDGVPAIGPTRVQPTQLPPRTGGGTEFNFPSGTPPGTVTGPFPLPEGK